MKNLLVNLKVFNLLEDLFLNMKLNPKDLLKINIKLINNTVNRNNSLKQENHSLIYLTTQILNKKNINLKEVLIMHNKDKKILVHNKKKNLLLPNTTRNSNNHK